MLDSSRRPAEKFSGALRIRLAIASGWCELVPSLLTMGNMFCGYALRLFAMRESTKPLAVIAVAVLLDMLDGRIARLTGTASAFGVEFDSLATSSRSAWRRAPVVSVGARAARRLAGRRLFFVAAAAMLLARFNVQSAGAGTSGSSSGCRSGRGGDSACTVFAYPLRPLRLPRSAAGAGDGPRARRAHGEHDPVPQLQDSGFEGATTVHRAHLRPAGIVAIATHPQLVLVLISYGYLASAFIELAITRLKRRAGQSARQAEQTPLVE